MGSRGRSRGMSMVNATSQPSGGSPIPPVAPCMQTDYDGLTDYIVSTGAGLKLGGYQTWCWRFKTDNGAAFQTHTDSQNAGRTSGINFITHSNGSQYINAAIGGVNKEASDATSLVSGTWYTIVLVASATELAFWKNGVKCSGPLAIDANINAPVSDFHFGRFDSAGSQEFNGQMTNLEAYTGAATNPASWTPGNTSSLTGTTLVMSSPYGNGADNNQGYIFTEGGSPTLEACD